MNFAKALDVKIEAIERPPLPPVGHYVWEVSKPAIFGDMKDGAFDTLDFPCRALEATADVDTAELKKFGGIKMVTQRVRFMFNNGTTEEDQAAADRSKFNLKTFLTNHLGIDASGITLKEAIDMAQGRRFLAPIQYRPDRNDPSVVYAELGRTAPTKE
jgi:hypothetical protein